MLIRNLGYAYTGNEKWSRERITNDIRNLASQRQDLLAGGIYRSQKTLTAAAARFFGSWRAAVVAAGFRVPLHPPGVERHREAHRMAHTNRDQQKFLVRAQRIRGRILALEKALARKEDCSKILHLIAGSRGAMDNLMVEILEGQIRFHVADPSRAPASERAKATEELIAFVRGYLK
jgi:DNA-binding FrmR family transcriptional regulator